MPIAELLQEVDIFYSLPASVLKKPTGRTMSSSGKTPQVILCISLKRVRCASWLIPGP